MSIQLSRKGEVKKCTFQHSQRIVHMETIDKENLWQGGFIWNWFPSKTKVEEIRPTIVDNVPALLGLSQAMAKKTPISLKQKGNFRIKIVESPLKSEISNTRAGEKNCHLLFLYAVVLAECHKITCSTNSLKHISTCGKFFLFLIFNSCEQLGT